MVNRQRESLPPERLPIVFVQCPNCSTQLNLAMTKEEIRDQTKSGPMIERCGSCSHPFEVGIFLDSVVTRKLSS